MDVKRIVCDVLVVGAGGAGIMAALEADRGGARTCLVDKSAIGRGGATICANSALAAAIGHADAEDNFEVHFQDVLEGGRGLSRPEVAKAFTRNAPEAIARLAEYGVPFLSMPDGKFRQFKGVGHRRPRTLTAGFRTGLKMVPPLLSQLRKRSQVIFQPYTSITKLFRNQDGICGALGWEMRSGKFTHFVAKAVIVATGGGMMIYPKTTSSRNLTGDGFALAVDVGASLVDMECVQFLPTGLVSPRGLGVTKTIAEALRPKTGGVFRNKNGEAFMSRYSPDKKDMSTWDVLAAAVFSEISEGRGCGEGEVYLDLGVAGEEAMRAAHGSLIDELKELGLDVVNHPITVTPMAHYFNGGIRIDENASTGIPGLFAAGEVTGGVHGANRLPGDALSDAAAFGFLAGIKAADYAKQMKRDPEMQQRVLAEVDRVLEWTCGRGGAAVAEVRQSLQATMGQNVGVARDEDSLNKALIDLGQVSRDAGTLKIASSSLIFNLELLEALELTGMVRVAQAVTASALLRRESRGCHSRRDCPERDLAWQERNVVIGPDWGAHVEERGLIDV